jgi:hypothetical protein
VRSWRSPNIAGAVEIVAERVVNAPAHRVLAVVTPNGLRIEYVAYGRLPTLDGG